MGLGARVLGEASGGSHAEQGGLLGTEHHAGRQERGLKRGAILEETLSESRGEHLSFCK